MNEHLEPENVVNYKKYKDYSNKFFVSSNGKGLRMHSNKIEFTPDEALNLAAWLVSLAEPLASESFQKVLDEVQST